MRRILPFCSPRANEKLTQEEGGEVLQHQIDRELVNRPLQFDERSRLFIGAHDETLFVAMRVHNPDRSALKIQG